MSTRGGNDEFMDEFMVVVVDGIHIRVSRVSGWLRVGLPQLGAALSEVYPTAARASVLYHG